MLRTLLLVLGLASASALVMPATRPVATLARAGSSPQMQADELHPKGPRRPHSDRAGAGRTDREGSAPLPQVDEHGGPPSYPSQQEAVRVEPRQGDPQEQGVGDAAGACAAVGPEQVLSSSCFEPPLSPTWL